MRDKEIYELLLEFLKVAQGREVMNVAMARLVNSQLVLLETTLLRGLEVAARPNWEDRGADLRALGLWLERSEHRDEFRTLLAQIESGHEATEAMLDDLKRVFESPD